MDEESGTMAAWAALGAAIVALLIALAQATQQYVATAQNMRKCEKSVWGPMPGHPGRRVWVWHQLRFRIVYDMANIFIPTEYWHTPGNAREFPAHRTTALPAPFDPPSVNPDPEGAVQSYSEACWVAFARHLSFVCPIAIRLGLLTGDVDRLPADLPVVPMQISVRDLIALGLTIGMSLQYANDDHVEMSGPSGMIKTSDHPLLGKMVHFTAFSAAPRAALKGLLSDDISRSWLRRLQGIVSVAKQEYDVPKRRYYESLALRWRTYAHQLPQRRESMSASDDNADQSTRLRFVDMAGKEHSVPADECDTWELLTKTLEIRNIATAPYIIRGPENKTVPRKSWKPLLKVIRKGDLQTTFKIVQGDYIEPRPAAPAEPSDRTEDNGQQPDGPDVADGSGDGKDSIPMTSIDPAGGAPVAAEEAGDQPGGAETEPAVPLPGIAGPEPAAPRPSVSRKAKPARAAKGPLLAITYGEDAAAAKASQRRQPRPYAYAASYSTLSPASVGTYDSSDDERNAPSVHIRYMREGSHRHFQPSYDTEAYWKAKQSRAYVSANTPTVSSPPPVLSFFWASQLDIQLGYWATPWSYGMYSSCCRALPMMADMALEGLKRTARKAQSKKTAKSKTQPGKEAPPPAAAEIKEIIHVDFHSSVVLDDLWVRLRNGDHTWPPYAINARGGGLADMVPVSSAPLITFSAFADEGEKLPPLTLLRSVHDARLTASAAGKPKTLLRDRILELACIDLWLAHAAVTESIDEGERNLVSNAAAVVEEIWLEFGYAIMDTRDEQWSRDGGDWAVRRLAKRICEHLSEELSSPAEVYFAWVAFLRAVKVLECINDGPDRWRALSSFEDDLLVYMV
ncbi:hypothetical protein QBC34DRAFT_416673 [Podospora aff. communis PSN243]|uniref:Uncharacterized protein n=1 Tax=Podospora aff. communis PSN243 TaxID=3040156 RepID=A0AAV9G594_9PEZI|nr:hypothetical protein QBC34DRAFT_416673 [Podospora aff. communis PSN243]